MVATSFLKRRQQVPKPRDRAPKFINRWSLRRGKCGGSIDETVKRRGVVGSAGVVERGKGTGWIAWKPGRSRFLPCSFGFRPGRSAHQALQYLRAGFMSQRLRWLIDIDIKNILIRYHTLTFGTFLTGESWMA